MTRFGTFPELVAAASPAVAAIARALRELVLDVHADAVEVVRLGDNAASYGLGPKKMSEAYVYIMPMKDRVNLGFYHGVNVPDPAGLLEGTGKKLRHVKVHSSDAAAAPAIRALIEAALTERRSELGHG